MACAITDAAPAVRAASERPDNTCSAGSLRSARVNWASNAANTGRSARIRSNRSSSDRDRPSEPFRATVQSLPVAAEKTSGRSEKRLMGSATVLVQPWQLLDLPASSVDAIMYDTWPPEDHADADFTTFVERVAAPVLRPGGRFSFFHSGTRLSVARARTLDQHFPGWFARPYRLQPETFCGVDQFT